jgi:hypothetical protein
LQLISRAAKLMKLNDSSNVPSNGVPQNGGRRNRSHPSKARLRGEFRLPLLPPQHCRREQLLGLYHTRLAKLPVIVNRC